LPNHRCFQRRPLPSFHWLIVISFSAVLPTVFAQLLAVLHSLHPTSFVSRHCPTLPQLSSPMVLLEYTQAVASQITVTSGGL